MVKWIVQGPYQPTHAECGYRSSPVRCPSDYLEDRQGSEVRMKEIPAVWMSLRFLNPRALSRGFDHVVEA